MSPHKALYGYSPRHVALEGLPLEGYCPIDERVKALMEIHNECKKHLQEQQQKRNLDYNEKRKDIHYEPGDLIKLRIHERTSKLSPFWKGPYTVIRKVSPVNYEIDLPTDTSMSRIIHVQHMKPWYSRESDLSHIPREKPPMQRIKATKKEINQTDIANRPITRAYKKILDKVEKEKNDLSNTLPCIYNIRTQFPEFYFNEKEQQRRLDNLASLHDLESFDYQSGNRQM